MHFAISATWGPVDPTRAALPFVFAASALQAGDSMTIMLLSRRCSPCYARHRGEDRARSVRRNASKK